MRLRLACAVALSAASLAGLSGCAHADSAAERHFTELHDAVTKIEVEQDKTNQRLFQLEAAADEKKERAAGPKNVPGAPPRTVQLGDGSEGGENDDPNDPASRPEIRLQGAAQATAPPRAVRGKSASEDDRSGEARRPRERRSSESRGRRSEGSNDNHPDTRSGSKTDVKETR